MVHGMAAWWFDRNWLTLQPNQQRQTGMTDEQYLQKLIAEGEHEQQDFKYKVQEAAKLARSVSAFANTRGGRLLIGVRDDGHISGVRS